MARTCEHCSAPLADGDLICRNCGQSVAPSPAEAAFLEGGDAVHTCPHCGAHLDPARGDTVCTVCGEHLSQAMAPDESLAHQYAGVGASGYAGEGGGGATTGYGNYAAPSSPHARYVVFRCNSCRMPLVPGTNLCPKCGRTLAEPVPKIEIHQSPEPPIQRYGQYLCPECQSPLSPGSSLCTNCGAEFLQGVPQDSMLNSSTTLGNASYSTIGSHDEGISTSWKIGGAIGIIVILLLIGLAISSVHTPPATPVAPVIAVPDASPGMSSDTGSGTLAPVVLPAGNTTAGNPANAPSPIGSWAAGRDTVRIDPLGGAWIDAPAITGSATPVFLNWTLLSDGDSQIVRVTGPSYSWDFKWSVGADGSDTLSNAQWGELHRRGPPRGARRPAPRAH